MKHTLRYHSSKVVNAWAEFKRDPANKLPMVAEAIEKLDAFLKQSAKDELDKNQLKIFQ